MSRIAMVVVLFSCGLLAAGCADRPSTADLTQSIISAAQADEALTVSEDEARCIAARLLDTDLSDTTLSGLANNFTEPDVLSAESGRVMPAVTDAARACIGNS